MTSGSSAPSCRCLHVVYNSCSTYVYIYIYIYIHIHTHTCMLGTSPHIYIYICTYICVLCFLLSSCLSLLLLVILVVSHSLGNFTSQDFDIFPRSFCADASSPQISATVVGHFTRGKCQSPKVSAILRKTYTQIVQTIRNKQTHLYFDATLIG